ncbi:hypothetical protein FO519_002130 [Halicephalobus sp. NKZ332]|nr:hypothetical protein FO519_002130 [Halicephalobus sp. NKZ332]
MDAEIREHTKRIFRFIFKNRQTNVILTSLVAFVCIYITIVALFRRSFIDPLEVKNTTNIYDEGSTDVTATTDYIDDVTDLPLFDISPSYEEDYILTLVSLFFLWILALAFGKIVSFLFLPPLLGMLIAGILFGNVPGMKDFLIINKFWEQTVRHCAFLLILIRAGVSIDPDILKNSLYICSMLGFGSTTVEVIVITLAAHFLYSVPVAIAIPFGYILASTSPAITVPTMIRLQKEERGTDKGIPTVILTSATIDNLYCITVFYIALATTLSSSNNGQLAYTIPRVLVETLMSGIIGLLAGLVLRSLPQKDAGFLHFARAAMTISMSLAMYYGTRGIQCYIAGPVIVFLMCIVATMRWKYDNPHRTKKEERGFRIMWIFFFQPLLFALIGLLFDFSVISWELFGNAMSIIILGLFFRAVAAFVISLCTSLDIQEQGFMSICFSPKATVQAALAPVLAVYCLRSTEYSNYADLILQTCILSILITAPIGQLLILGLGRAILHKKTVVADYHISNIGSNVSVYLQPNGSEKPKPLEIEIKPPPTQTDRIPPPLSFKEINQQAHKIFKEQKITSNTEKEQNNFDYNSGITSDRIKL